MPKPMGAVSWWGADDHSWSPKIPVHGGASKVHASYDDAITGRRACRAAAGLPGQVTEFSFDAAWWLSQAVADQVYSKFDRAAPVVTDARLRLQRELTELAADAKAKAAFEAGDAATGLGLLDDHAMAVGATATAAWLALWQSLLVKFIDGMTTVTNAGDPSAAARSARLSATRGRPRSSPTRATTTCSRPRRPRWSSRPRRTHVITPSRRARSSRSAASLGLEKRICSSLDAPRLQTKTVNGGAF